MKGHPAFHARSACHNPDEPCLFGSGSSGLWDRISYRTFSLRTLKQGEESAELLGRETLLIQGVETAVSRVSLRPPEEVQEHTVRFDPMGRWLSASYLGDVESRLEPEEAARKITVCHDLFTRGVVQLDKPMGVHPKDIAGLVLEVPADSAKAIPRAPGQIISMEGEKAFLRLGAEAEGAVAATGQSGSRTPVPILIFRLPHGQGGRNP